MSKIEFTAEDADTLRRTVVQLTATLKGIELQMQLIAETSKCLVGIEDDFAGLRRDLISWNKARQKS